MLVAVLTSFPYIYVTIYDWTQFKIRKYGNYSPSNTHNIILSVLATTFRNPRAFPSQNNRKQFLFHNFDPRTSQNFTKVFLLAEA
jgi:hypothetical protein